jgi:hypothetical protein
VEERGGRPPTETFSRAQGVAAQCNALRVIRLAVIGQRRLPSMKQENTELRIVALHEAE